MGKSMNVVIRFFKDPSLFVQQATPAHWTQLVHQCREQALLGSAYLYLQPYLEELPAQIVSHFESGKIYADKQQQTLMRELLVLEQVFAEIDFPILLVKGVAYRLHKFAFAAGRVFSDLDLLVPATKVQPTVELLQSAGFMDSTEHDYDRRYYLEWSHQHPPLRHYTRGSEIDLHHTIFFAKSTVHVDIHKFIENSTRLNGSCFSLPAAADMFVHSCLHLLFQEEYHKITKDLVDLHELYKSIDNKAAIIQSAALTNKPEVVALGLHLLATLFNVELSKEEMAFVSRQNRLSRLAVAYLVRKLTEGCNNRLAKLWWVARGHLIKMPWYLLIYHSVAKVWFLRQKKQKLSQYQQEIDKNTRPHDA
ncbi:MAG TPA: hypothetical protein DCS87_14575 [Rheinheimera sp.]|nr:hypothetical protein [Rheinheimera sp.]